MDILETIEYKGHDINIYYDELAENPFTAFDGEPDLIAYFDRGSTVHGDISPDYLPALTREQIKANIKTILELTECKSLLDLISEYAYNGHDYINTADAVNDSLQECYSQQYESDKLSFLSEVLTMAGIVNLKTTVTGYAQGQWADLLIVASDSFKQRTGATIDKPEQLQSSADLYQSWAFGDCYGYQVESIDESCWGFYGSDHEKSGLLEYAKNAIDCEIERQRKQHQEHVKTMIKNHVPLMYRMEI